MRTVLAALGIALATAPAAHAIEIHAHRGGTVTNGKATYAEESLAAYKHAAANGFVLEVDAKLTKDGVPVAVHDATLDRTTTCTGEVRAYTADALEACRFKGFRGRIPTIAEVLELARLTGGRVNLEIKNIPTDPDYDATPAYANRVLDVVEAAGLARSQVLIQSFWPPNLEVVKQRMPRVATSVLALTTTPDVITLARDGGYDYLSPQWPLATDLIRQAHAAGLLVLPYTINEPAQVRAAARARVDGLITDDPLMAARTLGLRPPRALTARLLRHPARVEARGRLLRPAGVSRRKGCRGR